MLALLGITISLLVSASSLPITGPNEYGIILDAGSSSTKIRIYSWTDTFLEAPKFAEEFYFKVSPGIGSLGGQDAEILAYMQNIMDALKEEVPKEFWPTTSIYVMATAGLRLLHEDETGAIMDDVQATLGNPEVNPFRFLPENAHILSGEEEALHFTDSYGLIELGGGSAQIAFIPDDPIYAGKMPATIAGREYGVYCHSHLSYGASLIAERIVEYLVRENPYANVIVNPCMLKGDSANNTVLGKAIGLVGGGNASLCESLLNHFLATAEPDMCSPKPCSIGQVYQPPVKARTFFTFGLIYYLAKDLKILDGPGTLDLAKMQTLARVYCQQSYDDAVSVLNMSPKYASRNCQDGLYIPLLFSALGFQLDTQQVMAAGDINKSSVAWSLGGMLYEEERSRYMELTESIMGHESTGL
ncbi:ENTP3-like protein [Mya arenaria]|uniref:ENTP3-like protein n=1 Tax=Mya arenaria TaxID=6604 RepID=A0ABY7DKZ4_MYAAR|nr:ENTP3-like protein [Mya arenaria]